ncbi:MAG: beta-propeller fold lactonase family protein [Bryobacteraceae bacterium]|jgi:6-phosphogluconolactonase (cycloisomerase 2 family)
MHRSFSRASVTLALFGMAAGAATAQPFAYVANNHNNDVSGYSVDAATGALTAVTGSPFSTGSESEPTSVAATRSGKFVYVARYFERSIDAFSVNATNGALTLIQGSPFTNGSDYPYGLAISPSGKFLYAANTPGNSISAFSIGATGALTAVAGSPFAAGTGTISVALTPSGKYLYASNSTGDSVSAFSVNSDGSLTSVTGSPYTAGKYPVVLAVSPSGKFLYVPNGDSCDISAFSIDSTTGALTAVSGSPFPTRCVSGTGPQAVAVAPSAQFLYAAGGEVTSSTSDVFGFSIDTATGALKAISGSPFPAGEYSAFVAVSSSGKILYSADSLGGKIFGYLINASTGALTPVAGSPFTNAGFPESIALVNPAAKTCGAQNVSAEATLAPGPFTEQSHGSGLWNETLTISNGVTPITGPLSVVLTGLPSSTNILSGSYAAVSITYCFSTEGNYVVPIDALLPPANDGTLLPGEEIPVPFVFQVTQGGSPAQPTAYKALLIAGKLTR